MFWFSKSRFVVDLCAYSISKFKKLLIVSLNLRSCASANVLDSLPSEPTPPTLSTYNGSTTIVSLNIFLKLPPISTLPTGDENSKNIPSNVSNSCLVKVASK